MANIQGRLAAVLRETKMTITRVVLWNIRHHSNTEDIALKIGRYSKSKSWSEEIETLKPRKELTLDNEELKALIDFLRESYEPFRQGVKAYIPLDHPFEHESAEQIKALFSLPDVAQLVDFILAHSIIPDDLATGLQHAQRVAAIREFENMLEDNLLEGRWQDWFTKNDWVLGSEFVRIIDERQIDTEKISDFLMQAYDGFLDVIEIKRPGVGHNFWASTLDHGNYVPSMDLTKAIMQSLGYIFDVESEVNSVKFLERVGNVKTVKPRCILIFGRSYDWNDDQVEAYRILNAGYHNLSIMTYDHVLRRAQRIVGLI